MYNLAQVLAGPLMAVGRELADRCSASGCGPRRASRCSARPSTRAGTGQHMRETRGARQLRHALGRASRSSRSSARTSRASARSSAPTATRIRWPCSSAARCRSSRRCGCTTARSIAGTAPASASPTARPHLRIENRVMPAGPSTARRDRERGVLARDDAGAPRARPGDQPHDADSTRPRANFYAAAREGLSSHSGVARRRRASGASRSCWTCSCRPPPRGWPRWASTTPTSSATSASSSAGCAPGAPGRGGPSSSLAAMQHQGTSGQRLNSLTAAMVTAPAWRDAGRRVDARAPSTRAGSGSTTSPASSSSW